MSSFLHAMSNVTLPIVLTCTLGALLQKWRSIDTRTLADISLYILAPCLLIFAMSESRNAGSTMWSILWFTLIHTALCWGLAWMLSRVLSLPSGTRSALSLTTIFGNSNNYGLPVLLLAYGSVGFSLGATYVIGQVILVNTLGLYIASRSNVKPRQAFGQILKIPLLYAAIAGMAIYLFRVQLPGGLGSSLKLLGDAYPAVVLIILGVQLKKMNLRGLKRKDVWVSVIVRMLAVPVLSKTTLAALGIHGLLSSILFVQSSMPAAINTVVLAEKYAGDTELVALTVAITTIISFVTLPILIAIGH